MKEIKKVRIGKAYVPETKETPFQLQFKLSNHIKYNCFSKQLYKNMDDARRAMNEHLSGNKVFKVMEKIGSYYFATNEWLHTLQIKPNTVGISGTIFIDGKLMISKEDLNIKGGAKLVTYPSGEPTMFEIDETIYNDVMVTGKMVVNPGATLIVREIVYS